MMEVTKLPIGATCLTTFDFIAQLFCRVDDAMHDMRKDPRANLWPSEVVTIGILFVLKGKSKRCFYRWLVRDGLCLFPNLPERTRLFRLLSVHRFWADRFLAEPTLVGVCDSFGVELLHPKREGRSPNQIGKKGLSSHRWIVGVTCRQYGTAQEWCPLINSRGQIVD